MAIKTFTTGEVLTASDTNTFLANAGLVYVTSGTLAASKTIAVNDCFNANYPNYRIMLTNILPTSTADIFFNLRASGTSNLTNYYYNTIYSSSTSVTASSPNNTTGHLLMYTTGQDVLNSCTIELFQPQVATQTKIMSWGQSYNGVTGQSVQSYGFHDIASAYTGFSMTSAATTISAKYIVYGYRSA